MDDRKGANIMTTPDAPLDSDLLAIAWHNLNHIVRFDDAGECECREGLNALLEEYERVRAEQGYLRRLPWRP